MRARALSPRYEMNRVRGYRARRETCRTSDNVAKREQKKEPNVREKGTGTGRRRDGDEGINRSGWLLQSRQARTRRELKRAKRKREKKTAHREAREDGSNNVRRKSGCLLDIAYVYARASLSWVRETRNEKREIKGETERRDGTRAERSPPPLCT